MIAVKAAGAATTPAGAAAARSVGQAAAVAHLAAHALGADGQRAALQRLPAVGTDTGGPLGPGLLAGGLLGETIRAIQAQTGHA